MLNQIFTKEEVMLPIMFLLHKYQMSELFFITIMAKLLGRQQITEGETLRKGSEDGNFILLVQVWQWKC
jgi:hypothetical protein